MRGERLRKNMILLIFAALLSYPIATILAQDGLSSSASMSFARDFPRRTGTSSLEESGMTITVAVDARPRYKGNLVLFTESSSRYAEKNSSTTVKSTVSNAISSIELNLEADVSINYGIGTADVPTYTVNLKHAVLETMGSSQTIVMGEYLLFSGHIPFFGVQLTLFMQPVVTYTPTLSGNIAIEGPASASPSSLYWSQEAATCQVQFSESEMVGLSLSDPALILEDFSLVLEMYAIMTAETLNVPAINVVNSASYSMSSPDVSLLSFEPNYYAFYTELKESYDTLTFTLESTQEALDEMAEEAGLLRNEVGALTVQLQNLTDRVSHLEAEDPLSGDLNYLQQQVETLSGTWDGLTYSMDQLNDEINALTLEVAAVKARLEESEQSTFMAIAVTVSFVSLILGSTSLWRSFTNNK